MNSPETFSRTDTLFKHARHALKEARCAGNAAPAFLNFAGQFLTREWTVLVAGLRSVGKSSFVSAFWGDADLLPTAVRDCTQTNTLVRVPGANEADHGLAVEFLARERALEFATKDLAFERLTALLRDEMGFDAPNLDALPPLERLRALPQAVRKLFADRPQTAVLYDPLLDEVEKLEQFLEFIETPAYTPGVMRTAPWSERREHLMGHRRPDGRTVDVGKLLAYARVHVVRASSVWPAGLAPTLIDTPWIPERHDARRAQLILEEAPRADVLCVVAHPEKFELEPWLTRHFREHPQAPARTLLIFNQVDMVDANQLYRREGWAESYEENLKRLRSLGLREANLRMTCARLPFLCGMPSDPAASERAEKLRTVLARLKTCATQRPESPFRTKVETACTEDGGLETVRARFLELRTEVLRKRAADALRQLLANDGLDAEIVAEARALSTLWEPPRPF